MVLQVAVTGWSCMASRSMRTVRLVCTVFFAMMMLSWSAPSSRAAEWNQLTFVTPAGFDRYGNLYRSLMGDGNMHVFDSNYIQLHRSFNQPNDVYSATGIDTSGFSSWVQDESVSQDGRHYVLVTNQSVAPPIAVIGHIQSDHISPGWRLNYGDTNSINPIQIQTDVYGNLFVLEDVSSCVNGTCSFKNQVVKKYSADGTMLWSRLLDINNLFSGLRPAIHGFQMFVNHPGSTVTLIGSGYFLVNDPKGTAGNVSGRTADNPLVIGLDGQNGMINFAKSFGDSLTHIGNEVFSALSNPYTVSHLYFPRQAAIDSYGNSLILGDDQKIGIKAFQTYTGFSRSSQPKGTFWLYIDRSGNMLWRRNVGGAIPNIPKINGDSVWLSSGNKRSIDPEVSIRFDGKDQLYVLTQEDINFALTDLYAHTGAVVSKVDMTQGVQWQFPIGIHSSARTLVQYVPGFQVDSYGNVYVAGIYYPDWGLFQLTVAEQQFAGRHFLEKNPQVRRSLDVSMVSGLVNQDFYSGLGVSALSLSHKQVLKIRLQANQSDHIVDTLTIASRGNGNEMRDITTVRLLAGDGSVISSLSGSAFVVGATKSDPYTLAFTNINRTVVAGTPETWSVEYDFSPTACAYDDNSSYGTQYTAQLIKVMDAVSGKMVAPVTLTTASSANSIINITAGEGATITILRGGFAADPITDNQGAPKNRKPLSPLTALVTNQSVAAQCDLQVSMEIFSSPTPASASGAILAWNSVPSAPGAAAEMRSPNNISGAVADDFWLGNIAGNYQVLARLYTPKGNPHGIPLSGAGTIEVIPPKKPIKKLIKTVLRKPPKLAKALASHSESAHVLFQVTARGVDIVSAAHNGNPAAPDLFGTFIQNIKASNTFTANVVPSSGFLDVSFDLGTVLVKGTGSGGVFTSPSLEMSTLAPGMNTLLVRARTSAGAFSDTASVWVLPFPGWVSPLQNIVTSFVLEFQPAKDRYHAGFSWPIDFVWSQAVDTAVLLLGGEKNDANLQFNANAFFYLNESSSFDASGGYKTTIFGHPLDLAAALNGSFNSSFKFLGGDGLFESTMDFEFPDKSISKTMLVYRVPVTVALEVGGAGHVTLNGNATLGSDLAFKKVLVVPGIDVTLSATASVAAVYGLAKIGVNASPLTEVQLKLLYTSIVPHLKTTFGGRLTVPVKLIGSIFWGLGKGTLASTTLGPYAFGSMVGGKAKMMRTPFALGGQGNTVIPEFIPSSSIAVDAFGRQMVVFTKDVDPVVGAVNPDVYYRYFNGSQWLAAAPVATEANFWEMDPDVTFLSGGAALALWTSNDGAKTLANLNDIFAHQDIRYALWNGSQWGAPGYVFKDTYADGVPALSYDAVNKKALAVWLHDVNSDRDLNTRHEWDIYSAVFDEIAGSWSAVTNLSGVDGYADYMPQVDARAGWGMAVWAEDVDGQFFTALPQITNGTNVSYANNDGVVRYALFNGTSWNAPQTVPGSNSGFVAFSEVAWNGDASKAVVVWVGKRDSTTRAGTVETQIYYAVFTRATNQWTVPKVVGAAGIRNKENLRVMVDASGVATIIWKGRGINGTDGDLYKTTLDLATDAYSSVVAMTRTSEAEVGFSSAMDGYGRVQAVWQRQDFAGGSDLSSAGMSGGLSLGQIGLQRAHFLGSIADHGIDVDGDGTLDLLRILVDFYAQPGSFLLSGQLADGYGNTFASAKTVVSPVASGLLRAALDFPAQVVAEHGLDGPYVLRNLRLDDLNNGGLLADVYSQQISTYGYALTDFGRGYVSFDRAAYDDLRNTTATITVRDAYANNSASVVDRVAVQVSSDLYAVAGITLTLTETGVDTGIFQGVLRFSQVVTNATTGEVQVADGSTLTVIYTDTKGVIRQSLATWSKGVTYISLDVDGNGVSNANDGVMILRRLNGAGTVTTGIVLPQGITNASVVGAIDQGGTGFDVDGDGDADANDGVMILRRMNGAGTVTTGIVLPANVGGVGGFGERTNGEVNGAIDGLR